MQVLTLFSISEAPRHPKKPFYTTPHPPQRFTHFPYLSLIVYPLPIPAYLRWLEPHPKSPDGETRVCGDASHFPPAPQILQRYSSRTQWPNGPAMTPLRFAGARAAPAPRESAGRFTPIILGKRCFAGEKGRLRRRISKTRVPCSLRSASEGALGPFSLFVPLSLFARL